MGNADQPPLGIDFLQTPQMESAKAHIVAFPIRASGRFGFGALAFERAILVLIITTPAVVAIVRLVLPRVEIAQALFVRADEFILLSYTFSGRACPNTNRALSTSESYFMKGLLMTAIAQQFRLFAKETFSWLFVAYLIFAGYVIFDTLTFAFDPISGRISSLSCKANPPNETICTVTLHGFLGTQQQSFPADSFVRAGISSLPGYSDCIPYGIAINAGSQQISFVSPQGIDEYQDGNPKLTQIIDEINGLFVGNTPPTSKTIFYNNVNPGLYPYLLRRIILLVTGLLIVLIYGSRKHSINKHKTNITEYIESTFAKDVFSWWKINILARLFFYLPLLLTSSTVFLYPIQFCQANVEFSSFYCPGLKAFAASPLGYLFCLYHFIAFTTLQGYLQWHYLKQKISLSAWWIATPIFAGISLLFVKSPVLTCDDCLVFRFLPSGAYPLNQAVSPLTEKGTIVLFLVYFFLLGCAQWFVLKHKLNSANSWIFTPLVNSIALVASGFLIQFLSHVALLFFEHDFFPSWIGIILWLILAFGIQDIISGLVISKILRANTGNKPEIPPTSPP